MVDPFHKSKDTVGTILIICIRQFSPLQTQAKQNRFLIGDSLLRIRSTDSSAFYSSG